MATSAERRLKPFLFPVEERAVYVADANGSFPKLAKSYKAVFREDKNRLISVMSDTYNVIPNSKIIMPLMESLHRLDTRWIIDPSHSYIEDSRMRLQVTFPDITLNDGESDIALSLFVHNSYNGSEGVRTFWGAIRSICSNGSVFGQVLSKYYHRHTNGVNLLRLKDELEITYENIPLIKERIETLKQLEVTDGIRKDVSAKMGRGVAKYVAGQQPAKDQWALYNQVTHFVSHYVDLRMRAKYQIEVSRLFQL